MIKLSERFVPKLRQTYITSNGEDLFKNVAFNFGPPIDSDAREDEEV